MLLAGLVGTAGAAVGMGGNSPFRAALLRGSELPPHHQDPFDRVILAHAQPEVMPVISPNGSFPACGIPLL